MFGNAKLIEYFNEHEIFEEKFEKSRISDLLLSWWFNL